MSDRRRSSARRRRSSNGLSLLPSEENFCNQIPDDIPADERALILIRKCYVRTLHKLQREHDVPEDLLRALTVDGTSAFQDLDHDDILMKILRATTGDAPAASVTADNAVDYHKKLGDLVAQSKEWDRLVESGYHFKVDLPPSAPDPADVAKMRNHYKMLTENCARTDQASSLWSQECTILAKRSAVTALAEPGVPTLKPSARDILGRPRQKP
ncbi:unnamed protein product, partial [Ixodes hexagonus]